MLNAKKINEIKEIKNIKYGADYDIYKVREILGSDLYDKDIILQVLDEMNINLEVYSMIFPNEYFKDDYFAIRVLSKLKEFDYDTQRLSILKNINFDNVDILNMFVNTKTFYRLFNYIYEDEILLNIVYEKLNVKTLGDEIKLLYSVCDKDNLLLYDKMICKILKDESFNEILSSNFNLYEKLENIYKYNKNKFFKIICGINEDFEKRILRYNYLPIIENDSVALSVYKKYLKEEHGTYLITSFLDALNNSSLELDYFKTINEIVPIEIRKDSFFRENFINIFYNVERAKMLIERETSKKQIGLLLSKLNDVDKVINIMIYKDVLVNYRNLEIEPIIDLIELNNKLQNETLKKYIRKIDKINELSI